MGTHERRADPGPLTAQRVLSLWRSGESNLRPNLLKKDSAVANFRPPVLLGGPSPAPPETAELFQALARSPDPVFATDRRLRIIFWNPSCQSLLGYSAEEMVGLSCSRALSGCDVFGNR